MASSIAFTDGTGTVTLDNGMPAPGDRFRGWQNLADAPNDGSNVTRVALGTGATYQWNFRQDYGAKFTLAYIPNSKQDDLDRFRRWAYSGGSFTVDTGDSSGRSYTCTLWPGSTVDLSPPDAKDLRLTLTVSVRNTVGAVMVCTYP